MIKRDRERGHIEEVWGLKKIRELVLEAVGGGGGGGGWGSY